MTILDMKNISKKQIQIQRSYYKDTADNYDQLHHDHIEDEHNFAFAWMLSLIDLFEIKSILDIGSGTGRQLKKIIDLKPDIKIIGIEPSQELREIGYQKNINKDSLINGDAMSLKFNDSQFDLVCEFGALHHIQFPNKAVSEMLRVSKKGIFISDYNNFGQGSFVARSAKQVINKLRLWKIFDIIKTKGKGYTLSEGDGLVYSYSVFNNYNLIKKKCRKVHLLNTQNGGHNLYKTSSHIALFGIK